MTQPVSRRGFLGHVSLAAAAAALARMPGFLRDGDWLDTAHAAVADLLHDTYNGLLAFVVPGRDEYSAQQGVSTTDPGGVESGGVDVLIATIDGSTPYFPNFSAAIAAILNGVALAINPNATGPFVSPFARLSNAEKAAVFQYLDSQDPYKVLAGVLPAFVAFFVYSEAGSFDPATRSLTGQPLGWTISNYQGAADGRDEFRGYLGEEMIMRDVIVVGAGGGGAVIAKELAARGLDVLLLEAGPRFADPERDWSHFESDANNPSSGYFRFGPADREKPPWVRDIATSMLLVQLAGVGGTTNHYQGNSPRAAPGAFSGYGGPDAARFDVAHLFPFRYRDLLPYYEWVEETLPVQTAPLGLKEEVFFDGARRLGLPLETTKDITKAAFRPQQNAILQPQGVAGKTGDPGKLVFPQAKGCTFCGHCSQGCFEPLRAPINLKAKRSTSVSYIPMALTCDRWSRGGRPVTLVADAFAVRVGLDSDGSARSITWRVGATGAIDTDEARTTVLSCGTVETPRLWLNSGLPNPNGWVGRGLTDHFVDLVSGIMPFDVGSSRGPGSNGRIDYPGVGMLEAIGVTPGLDAFLHAFSDGGIAGFYDNGLPQAQGADLHGRLVGRPLKEAMANIDRLLYIDVFTDDDVEQQNGVSLSSTVPPDEHGPVARVEIQQRNRSARTIANREFLVAQAVTLLKRLGATRVHRINKPPFVIHSHSTMRMGTSADDSVLDSYAEARWVKRLFVADNSALANGLGGPNPTLTTQALATRTAERIFQKYFDGHAWVEREGPVSSVDDVVTRAVQERGL